MTSMSFFDIMAYQKVRFEIYKTQLKLLKSGILHFLVERFNNEINQFIIIGGIYTVGKLFLNYY